MPANYSRAQDMPTNLQGSSCDLWSVCSALKDTCELLQGWVNFAKLMPSAWCHQQSAAQAYVSVNQASLPVQTTANAMVTDSCYL